MQVDPDARIYQISSPDDWVRLVEEFPRVSELDAEVRRDLQSVGYRNVGRWQRCLVPDWPAVAAVYDGVHLTWAGFLTVDARPIPSGEREMTGLRRWGSERTAWLGPVHLDPEPLPIDPHKLDRALAANDPRWDSEGRQWHSLGRVDPRR